MKKLLFLLLLFSQTALGAEPVGQIADLVGGVWVTQEGQSPALAAFKQSIHVGDVIETKKEGAVKILFVDDTLLTIKENSKALITKFLFNSEAKERKAVFDVLFGRVRTVVGRFFGKAQPVEIKTPLAIAGIRGTDVGALVQKKSSVFYCFEGLFDAYNVTIPDKIIQVKEGFFTEVLEGIPPSELLPIPADVLDNKQPRRFQQKQPRRQVHLLPRKQQPPQELQPLQRQEALPAVPLRLLPPLLQPPLALQVLRKEHKLGNVKVLSSPAVEV